MPGKNSKRYFIEVEGHTEEEWKEKQAEKKRARQEKGVVTAAEMKKLQRSVEKAEEKLSAKTRELSKVTQTMTDMEARFNARMRALMTLASSHGATEEEVNAALSAK
jgi:predicted  nucleic acid-binding Zn-ribbon protein